MPKFAQEHQFTPTSEAVRQILTQYNVPLSRFELAHSGIENLTVVVWSGITRYVLRVYRKHRKSDEAMRLELSFMDYLRANGLPVPVVKSTVAGDVLACTSISGTPWRSILMEYASGQHPVSYTPILLRDMAHLQAKMHLLGEQYARLHQVHRNTHTLQEAVVTKQLLNNPAMSIVHRAFVQRAQHYRVELASGLPWGVSHFDYMASNLFADTTGHLTAILDFDDVRYMPPIVCLGFTLHDILIRTKLAYSSYELYLRTYEAIRPLHISEKEILPKIMLFRHYLASIYDLHFGTTKHNLTHASALKDILEQEQYFMGLCQSAT